jgi:general secretion pathway protein G
MKALGNRRRGFTLIEVLMVVAILVLLAGVLVVSLGSTGEKTYIKGARLVVAKVCSALERYKVSLTHYPTQEEGGLEALTKKPEFGGDEKTAEKWEGPYLQASDLVDPWGSKIGYTLTDPTSPEALQLPYKVWSFGPNKQDDNGAPDDIRNAAWEDSEKANK